MNDPWNRFPRWPSTEPFGESLGYSGEPPISSGGILGNLGQTVQPPWMDSRPAPIASAAPRPPVGQPWDYSRLYRSPLEISDPEAAKFLAAWRRVNLAPSLFGFRPPTNSTQSRTSIGTVDQSSPVPHSDFTSAFDLPGQSPTAEPDPNAWQRSTSMAPLPSTAADNFVPTAMYLGGDNWGATSPPPRMSPRLMLDRDYSRSSAVRDPASDTISARTQVRGAELFPEPPGPSSGDGSLSNSDPSQWARAQDLAEILSDATPDNLWIPGADYAADGHHEFPRANYKGKRAILKGRMRPETQKVFDEAKTGRLYVRSINGRRHEFDEFHRQYNDATADLLEQFMQENNIVNRGDLTPDHWRAVLKAIAESVDPRIQTYRNLIRLFRTLPWLRGGGRGIE